MDDYCHVFVLTSLSIDENGDVKSRNVAVTFDLYEAEDHRNKGVEHAYDVFVVPGDWREDLPYPRCEILGCRAKATTYLEKPNSDRLYLCDKHYVHETSL